MTANKLATDKVKQLLPYLLTIILTLVVSQWFQKDTQKSPLGSSATNTPMSFSNVQVTQKTSDDQPDLKLTQRYTAIINNKKVEVPVKDAVADPSVSTASTGATGYAASVTQEIDITPLTKSLVPRWELGVGMGIDSNDKVYIPLSVQRNYQHDKAIQVELHLGSNEIKGVEVQHKWLF